MPSHGKQLTKIIIRMDVKSMQSQAYFLLSPLSARKIKGPTSLKSFCCASLPTFSWAERGANRTYVKCLVNLNVFFFLLVRLLKKVRGENHVNCSLILEAVRRRKIGALRFSLQKCDNPSNLDKLWSKSRIFLSK